MPVETSFGSFAMIAALTGAWMLALAGGLLALSTAMLRVWNPSREARPRVDDDSQEASLQSAIADESSSSARTVKAWKSREARKVWITQFFGVRFVRGLMDVKY